MDDDEKKSPKGPHWGKVDMEILESGLAPNAKVLYMFLAGRQGQQGYETFGQQYVATRLGWNRKTVAKHAESLRDYGLMSITGEHTEKAHYAIIHNPPWGIVNPLAVLPPVVQRYGRKGYRGPEASGGEMAKAASRALTLVRETDQLPEWAGPKNGPVDARLVQKTDQFGPKNGPPFSSKFALREEGSCTGLDTEHKEEGNRIDPQPPPTFHDEATNSQCHLIFAVQYDREWEWSRMADEIEYITGRVVRSPKGLTEDQAAAVLDSLTAGDLVFAAS